MCLTGAERDQVQGGGNGPGRRCWNALKSNGGFPGCSRAEGSRKNSLRSSSPLAKDVWLVIFRKTAAPFARLVPVATQHRFRYGIARGGAAGVRAEQVTTRSSLIVRVGEQFEGEHGWRIDALEAVFASSVIRASGVSRRKLCVEPSQGRLTTTAIPARHVQQRTFGVSPFCHSGDG